MCTILISMIIWICISNVLFYLPNAFRGIIPVILSTTLWSKQESSHYLLLQKKKFGFKKIIKALALDA